MSDDRDEGFSWAPYGMDVAADPPPAPAPLPPLPSEEPLPPLPGETPPPYVPDPPRAETPPSYFPEPVAVTTPEPPTAGYYDGPSPAKAVTVAAGPAVLSLGLGIAALFFCGPLTGIPAMIYGARAKREVEAGTRANTQANVGIALGLIATVFWGLVILAIIGSA